MLQIQDLYLPYGRKKTFLFSFDLHFHGSFIICKYFLAISSLLIWLNFWHLLPYRKFKDFLCSPFHLFSLLQFQGSYLWVKGVVITEVTQILLFNFLLMFSDFNSSRIAFAYGMKKKGITLFAFRQVSYVVLFWGSIQFYFLNCLLQSQCSIIILIIVTACFTLVKHEPPHSLLFQKCLSCYSIWTLKYLCPLILYFRMPLFHLCSWRAFSLGIEFWVGNSFLLGFKNILIPIIIIIKIS